MKEKREELIDYKKRKRYIKNKEKKRKSNTLVGGKQIDLSRICHP